MKEKSDESLAAANEAELEATVSMGSFFKKEELGGTEPMGSFFNVC